eukprot:674929-Rhodomonas_salina.4
MRAHASMHELSCLAGCGRTQPATALTRRCVRTQFKLKPPQSRHLSDFCLNVALLPAWPSSSQAAQLCLEGVISFCPLIAAFKDEGAIELEPSEAQAAREHAAGAWEMGIGTWMIRKCEKGRAVRTEKEADCLNPS